MVLYLGFRVLIQAYLEEGKQGLCSRLRHFKAKRKGAIWRMLMVQALIHQVCVSRRRSRWAWWEKLSAEVNMALVQMKTDWQKCQWYPGPWTWLYESSVRMDSLPRKRDLLSETQFRKTDWVEVIRECRTTHRYSSKASLGSGCTASTSILIACDEDSLGLDITLWYPITCANKPCPHQRLSAPLRLKIRLSLAINRYEPYWKKGLTSQFTDEPIL